MGFFLITKTGTEINTESEMGTMMENRGLAGSSIRSYLSYILTPVQKTSAHSRLNFSCTEKTGKQKIIPITVCGEFCI